MRSIKWFEMISLGYWQIGLVVSSYLNTSQFFRGFERVTVISNRDRRWCGVGGVVLVMFELAGARMFFSLQPSEACATDDEAHLQCHG